MAEIFLIDDERSFVKGTRHSLEREGHRVTVAYDGHEALHRLASAEFDLILLDLMLPGIDGITLCQKFREKTSAPIIILSARDAEVDRVLGLEVGADDYLTKPFGTRELLARVKAQLRRAAQDFPASRPRPLRCGDLRLFPDQGRATLTGEELELTSTELRILALLVGSPGRIFSREEILERVWGYDYAGDTRTIDVHVRRLREKIERDPGKPELLLTRWGTGYYMADRPEG